LARRRPAATLARRALRLISAIVAAALFKALLSGKLTPNKNLALLGYCYLQFRKSLRFPARWRCNVPFFVFLVCLVRGSYFFFDWIDQKDERNEIDHLIKREDRLVESQN
jgi:hypothetical protein